MQKECPSPPGSEPDVDTTVDRQTVFSGLRRSEPFREVIFSGHGADHSLWKMTLLNVLIDLFNPGLGQIFGGTIKEDPALRDPHDAIRILPCQIQCVETDQRRDPILEADPL